MEATILAFILILLVLAMKPFVIMQRSGILADGKSLPAIIIDVLIAPFTFSMIIWGFIHVEWWMAILMIISGSIIGGSVVTQGNMSFFHKIRGIPSLALIGLSMFAWINF